jgi:XRE family transcriptional regulator, master regulator for biofilm formation
MIRLREFRNERNMSQTELSNVSGVPQSVISDIETGVTKSPSIGIVLKLANALNMSVDALIDSTSQHESA